MTGKIQRSAEQRRAEIDANARQMQVDEAYISLLVETFYDRIRSDALLGPVFETAVNGHWDTHLSTMKDFWSSMALGTGRYDGRPMPKHMALKGITPAHFESWLALFYKTLQDTAPTQAAEDWFIERAVRVARGFQLNMFPYQPADNDQSPG